MKDVVKNSLGVNLKVLRIVQFSVDLKKQTVLDRVGTYIVFLSVALHVPLLSGFYFLFEENPDLTRLGDDALTVAASTSYALKMLSFIMNRKRIVDCIHFLDHVVLNLNKKQEEILSQSVKICKRNSYIFLIAIISGMTFWTVKPILLSTHKLPIDIWPSVNIEHNKTLFWCVYFYVALGACYPSIVIAGIDPLVASLACLASGYLRILKDNLQFLEDYAEIELEKTKAHPSSKRDLMYEKVRHCILLHNQILQFTKEIERCFSEILLCQFIGSIFSICFCCYHLSMLEPFSMEFLSVLDYLIIILAQIYFYCFYGTELSEESKDITNAIYMSNWYRYDVELRRALLVMMELSKRPIVITTGKVFVLSLETFATVLRRSYSLLAVLNNQ